MESASATDGNMDPTNPPMSDVVSSGAHDKVGVKHRILGWSALATATALAVLAYQVAATRNDDYFTPAIYAISGFSLCLIARILHGDIVTTHPQDTVRTAILSPRRIKDCVPTSLTCTTLLLLALLSTTLMAATATAPLSVGQGMAGWIIGPNSAPQSIACGHQIQPHSVWPDVQHVLPIVATISVGTVTCAWAVWQLAHSSGAEHHRRMRSQAIIGAWGLLVSAQLLVVVAMILSMLPDPSCAGPIVHIIDGPFHTMGILGLVGLAWSLTTLARAGMAVVR
ncbi:hypothetical protein [Streptomyces werraensis]|uniref:hypothetical protein n=1 Tax=Streptomyces werraensis TaxID=68284 RepID=UPI00381DE39F